MSCSPSPKPGIGMMFSPPVTFTTLVVLSTLIVTFPVASSGTVTFTITSCPTVAFSTVISVFP